MLPFELLWCFKFKTICITRSLSVLSVKYDRIDMAYTSIQSTQPEHVDSLPVVIMHGLLGSKNNWKAVGKAINHVTGRRVIALDARNHGDSPHTLQFNFKLLAEDILHFLEKHNIPKATFIGHSMGGRAIMAASKIKPSVVEKLIVVDVSPLPIQRVVMEDVMQMLQTMKSTNISDCSTIAQAKYAIDKNLKPVVKDAMVREFVMTNIIKKEGIVRWRMNLESILDNFNTILDFHISNERTYKGEVHFICGGISNFLSKKQRLFTFDDDLIIRKEAFMRKEPVGLQYNKRIVATRLKLKKDECLVKEIYPTALFHYIKNAGHWVHVEEPHEFLKILLPILKT